jgi:DNA-binding transcriptional ArsR family regulator
MRAVNPKPLRHVTDVPTAELISHPVRMRLLNALVPRDATTAELAAELGEPEAVVEAHLRTLVAAGQVHVDGDRWLTRDRWVVPNETWAQMSAGARQIHVEEATEMMAEQVSAAVVNGSFEREDAVLAWMTLRFDPKGFADASALMTRLLDDLTTVSRESAARLETANGTGVRIDAMTVSLLFEAPPEL